MFLFLRQESDSGIILSPWRDVDAKNGESKQLIKKLFRDFFKDKIF